MNERLYRGRLAPSPTGYLHLGHARTFWIAWQRAKQNKGVLVLRNEDLDPDRCRSEYVQAMIEDLHWLGIEWQEGPMEGGPHAPYIQSQRLALYRSAFVQLREGGFLYPCTCSRKDVQRALQAPHAADDEPLYPGTCRHKSAFDIESAQRVNWRFRVPKRESVEFVDGQLGKQVFDAGKDFGDFVVWRHDGIPSYQLAVMVDDAAMHITEVVRGTDLLVSTARQLLLYRSLQKTPPTFFHCPLMTDESGIRLAKRHDALSLRHFRAQGRAPSELLAMFKL
ncbi:MAG: Glutamate--tRNA ligase [Verrucomicrobiales bacterium]|nr:Glutamate--tRNA ligase [Verrucomicrobiales bacterium]